MFFKLAYCYYTNNSYLYFRENLNRFVLLRFLVPGVKLEELENGHYLYTFFKFCITKCVNGILYQ